MLALRNQSSSSSANGAVPGACTPNILPCTVHHTGPVSAEERYWNPRHDEASAATGNKAAKDPTISTQTAYFRGRKLKGRRVELPTEYQGVLLQSTSKVLPHTTANIDIPDSEIMTIEDDAPEPVRILECNSTFDEVVVWNHEALPAADHPVVKGVEEWIRFAEAMHQNPDAASNCVTSS